MTTTADFNVVRPYVKMNNKQFIETAQMIKS
jgi:hypothetical protein